MKNAKIKCLLHTLAHYIDVTICHIRMAFLMIVEYPSNIAGWLISNPIQFILGFAGGLWLGYITVKSKSLIPALVCHCTANTIIECLSIYEQYDEVTVDVIFNVWVFSMPILAIICAVIFLKWEKKSDMDKLPPRTEYHRRRDVPIFFSSVPVWVFMAIMLLTIISGIEPV